MDGSIDRYGTADAMRFYERKGYHRITSFGAYAGQTYSVRYARALL